MKMNQDVELSDQNVKPPPQAEKVDVDFVSAINDRQLGFTRKKTFSFTQINSTAEDELVKKQFKELHCELPGVPRSTFLMEFSPDGTKVASTHGNHQIYVTDVRSGKHIKTLIGHPRTPWCIAFHPTSNQIIASGCLGGQVRIWDLSGGSEVWTTDPPSVIASIAFHPSDRLLVIATFNQLYFWDWSSPEPFTSVSTCRAKEKVRYVAFDKLGHKLITGITNTPQTRWERLERVRAVPVSVSVPVVSFNSPMPTPTPPPAPSLPSAAIFGPSAITNDILSRIPVRERRMANCYRELVHQYEVLVHRYLQIYRRPLMIDQGTDPMEIEPNQTTQPQPPPAEPTPSTSTASVPEPRPDSPPLFNSASSMKMKSSASCPAKNRNRRLLYHSDGSSSSSSEHPKKKGKITGGTQTHETPARSISPQPGSSTSTNDLSRVCNTSSSSSSSDDDDDYDSAVVPPKRPCIPTENPESAPSTSSAGGQSKYVKVRLRSMVQPPQTSRTNEPIANGESEPKFTPQSNNTPTSTTNDTNANNNDNLLEPSTSTSSPRPSSTPPNQNIILARKDNLNNMLNNAKLMLASLKKRVRQGLTVTSPTLPSPGPSSRPSKGTSTNEPVPMTPPKRKRRLLRPNLLGNILFTSSDDSSSDNESSEATPSPLRRVEDEIVDVGTTSTSSAMPATSSDHSYAEAKAPNKIKLIPPKRKRLVGPEEQNPAPSQSEPTAPPSEDPPTTSQSNETGDLMDRCMQRLVVEALSVLEQPSTSSSTPTTARRASVGPIGTTPVPPPAGSNDQLLCGSCGGHLDEASPDGNSIDGCARTATICTRLLSPSRDTNSVGAPSPTRPFDRARRRFLSSRLSAFHPTRLLRVLRDRDSTTTDRPPRILAFAQDEVINFAERDSEESSTVPTITVVNAPESTPSASTSNVNVGIGTMYSNIVQELESSLNVVSDIRFRFGEMSSILSNFSERLEGIMQQSSAILRHLNLGGGLDETPAEGTDQPTNSPGQSQPAAPLQASPDSDAYSLADLVNSNSSYYTRHRNPVNSDHTYPINPDTTQAGPMTPLHLSLQFTVTHIQRQIKLLLQQVESFERIDRAMIEISQVQMIRQMFEELRVHYGANSSENRNGVSSVRQMMAGTRISDSSPYDSPSDEGTSNNANANDDARGSQPSTSDASNNIDSQPSTSGTRGIISESNATGSQSARTRARKNFPRCLYLMQRQMRRTDSCTLSARRNAAKDRVLLRRNIYRRFLPSRTSNELSSLRSNFVNSNLFNAETFRVMARRLQDSLLAHTFSLGRVAPLYSGTVTRNDEHVITLRLNNCRLRMGLLMGNYHMDSGNVSVSSEGQSRYLDRQTLSLMLDTITRFVEVNPNANICTSFRSQIWEVLELALMLCDFLLLQIIDSIPSSSGVVLEPELNNLWWRVDQMCTRLIQMRLMGQSGQLTRSLRMMPMTVLHASRSLAQTYTVRRNQMLATNNDNEHANNRQSLLDNIYAGLRNVRRYRDSRDILEDETHFNEWYLVLNTIVGRNATNSAEAPPITTHHSHPAGAALNIETGEEVRPSVTVEDANSSDDNANNNETVPRIRPARIGFFQSINLPQENGAEEERLWRTNYINVPTVQVNDVPLPPSHELPSWRGRTNHQRLSERLDELRTFGLLRPRFLHPLYSGVNPFEDNLDDAHREPIDDSDVIPTVTPNHRIQVWDFSQGMVPVISNAQKNLVVKECKIHNDASVDYASDGSILVTLLPYGGYMNVTNRLGVFSLEWETLGQCLYVASFEQNAVSVSLSPTNRHLVVGLASRRVSLLPTETWTIARIFLLENRKAPHGILAPIRELEQNRDTNYMSVNCIRWLPTAGQGLIFGTNTGHLRLLT